MCSSRMAPGDGMTTVSNFPTPVDVEVVAGDPFAVTFTATSGVTTFASPAVTVTTAAGDAYDRPRLPGSAASAVLTCAWSAADTVSADHGHPAGCTSTAWRRPPTVVAPSDLRWHSLSIRLARRAPARQQPSQQT